MAPLTRRIARDDDEVFDDAIYDRRYFPRRVYKDGCGPRVRLMLTDVRRRLVRCSTPARIARVSPSSIAPIRMSWRPSALMQTTTPICATHGRRWAAGPAEPPTRRRRLPTSRTVNRRATLTSGGCSTA